MLLYGGTYRSEVSLYCRSIIHAEVHGMWRMWRMWLCLAACRAAAAAEFCPLRLVVIFWSCLAGTVVKCTQIEEN